MPLNDYSPAELQPRGLTHEETKAPHEVIHNFFDYGHLPEIRAHMWNWLKLTTTGAFITESINDRDNLFHFYEQLGKLVEATHVIHRQLEDPNLKGTEFSG